MAYSDTMKVYPQISENLWFNINQERRCVRMENVEFSLCVCIWKITKVCFNILLLWCSMHFKYNLHWNISTSFIDNNKRNKIPEFTKMWVNRKRTGNCMKLRNTSEGKRQYRAIALASILWLLVDHKFKFIMDPQGHSEH